MPEPGVLVLVVGPSGVGKDTLIDGARVILAGAAGIVFVRREITRPAEAGGEDHAPVSRADFAARRAAGDYLLAWEANGHGYGAPARYADDLAAGRTVVLNASRTIVEEARVRFAPVRIASVTASPETLRTRLSGRARESALEIEARLARAAAAEVSGPDVTIISNDGPAADGVAALAAVINRARPGP